MKGEGVQQNFAEARRWCGEAAKDEDPRAYFCLGIIDQQGLGGEKNPKKARDWYQQATSRGHAQAAKALAQMYASGEGGKVDRPLAWLIYFQLVLHGDNDLLPKLVEIKKQMDKKEWDKVQKQLISKHLDQEKVSAILQKIEAK